MSELTLNIISGLMDNASKHGVSIDLSLKICGWIESSFHHFCHPHQSTHHLSISSVIFTNLPTAFPTPLHIMSHLQHSSTHLIIYLCVHHLPTLSTFYYFYPSTYPSIHLSIHSYIQLYIYLTIHLFLPTHLSI